MQDVTGRFTSPDNLLNLFQVEYASAAGVTGDYNNNGTVDAADYVVWRKNLNTSTTLPNDSTPGTVNQADYDIWRANFGRTPGAGSALLASDSSSSVPEPATAAMLLMGLVAIRYRACRHTSLSCSALRETVGQSG